MKKEAKIYLCLILLFPLWVLWGCAHFVGYRYPTFSSKEAKEHYIKAYRYFDSQRYDLAIPELQIVVDLEPQNSEGHASLGRLNPSLEWPSQLADLSRSRQGADKNLSTIETEHFQVKLDLTKDSTAVGELIPVLEQVYEQLWEELEFSPEKKTIIAFYPTEELYRMATPENIGKCLSVSPTTPYF